MLIACVVAYNEGRMLPGCLESVLTHGGFERMVVVDGAYSAYPHEAPFSTDATEAIARVYGAEWIGCRLGDDGQPRAWYDEVEKRSAYLVGQDGDWYVVLDADERLQGRLPNFEDGQSYALLVKDWMALTSWCYRVFQHRGWMRYEGAHTALWSDDRLVTSRAITHGIPHLQCYLMHLTQGRTADEVRRKAVYTAWQQEHEREYRIRYGI